MSHPDPTQTYHDQESPPDELREPSLHTTNTREKEVSKPVMTGMTRAERKEQIKNCSHMWDREWLGRMGQKHCMCRFCGVMKTTKIK